MKTKSFLQQLFGFVLMAALSIQTLNAQTSQRELIGLAVGGGTWRDGTMFKINTDATDLRAIFHFKEPIGRLPYGSVIQASNGSLYGMTSRGGFSNSGNGTIFKVKADGTGYVVLHRFDPHTGVPMGSLIQGTDGMLYGQGIGGFVGYGAIFKINLDGTGFQIIHHMNGNDGIASWGSLIQGTDGMLYGTASARVQTEGVLSEGLLFRLRTDGSDYEVIRRFNEAPGVPLGTLLQGENGALYGFLGGRLGYGAIFRINPDGSNYQILHDLGPAYGFNPATALVQGPDGNLYGMTQDGGVHNMGTIIRINPDGQYFSLLHHFDGDGAHPAGIPIIMDDHLWAFTRAGGEYDGGVIFKYNLATEVYTKVADFTDDTGTRPQYGNLLLVNTPASVVVPEYAADNITFSDVMSKTMTVSFVPGDGSNHLAVMKAGSPPTFTPSDNTQYSGNVGAGETVVYNGSESSFALTGLHADTEYYITIFEYNGSGSEIRYLVADAPVANRHTRTASDKIFGTAAYGGRRLGGTIFKFDPRQPNSLSVVHGFNHQFGMHPPANVIEASDGFLYGTTTEGSAFASYGTIFKVSPDGTQHTVLHNFDGTNGRHPPNGLVQASNNLLYGVANGGAAESGVIFSIRTDGTDYHIVHSFNFDEGISPVSAPLQASNGLLYGVTYGGGTNNIGTIYQINLDGEEFRVLHHFSNGYEISSHGPLIQGSDGFLYGTSRGNFEQPGSIFKINMDGSDFRTIHTFSTYELGNPEGALVQIPDGTLYGTAVGTGDISGPYGYGNMFKIQPDGTGYQVVHIFNGDSGFNPKGPLAYHNNSVYGFTNLGGATNGGVVFKYDLATNSFTKLYDLDRPTGTNPWSSGPIVVNAPDPETNFVVTPKHSSMNVPLKVKVTANQVADATTYTIELNPDPGFDETTAIIGTGERVQTFSNLKMGTKYYNRVRTDVTPFWGAVQEFSTGDVLTLAYVVSPINRAQNVSYAPTLEANAIEGATTYTIQLSRYMFFDTVAFERTANSTKLSFTGLDPGTLYYSRVKTDLVDAFGPIRYFTTGTAQSLSYVVGPGNNSIGIGTRPVVKANVVPDATSYTIQLSEQADFSSLAFEITSPSNWIQFNGLKYNTKYYNRVRTNLTFDFGLVKNFTTRTPESITYVTSPSDGASGVATNALRVTSTTVPGASQYTIQLSETTTFNTIAFEMTAARPAMTFNGLKPGIRYYNRVRTDLTTMFGETRSFSTATSSTAREISEVNMQHSDEDELKVHAYPNPFNERLTVYVESMEEAASIALVDLNGRRVHESIERTNSIIELVAPPYKGVFFLRVQTGLAVRVKKVVNIN